MPGVISGLKLIPSENVAIAVVFNGNPVAIKPSVEDIVLAALLPEWAEHLKSEGSKDQELANYPLPSSIRGEWEGEIKTYEGVLPVKMVFKEDGDIHVRLADQMETLLNKIRFRKGDILKGDFWAHIKTSDTERYPHNTIHVEMTLRGNRLSGYAAARCPQYGLSSWIHLDKKE